MDRGHLLGLMTLMGMAALPGMAEILGVEEERVAGRDNTPWLTPGSGCNCRRAWRRPIMSRPGSRCAAYPDAALAVFRWPPLLARRDRTGALTGDLPQGHHGR